MFDNIWIYSWAASLLLFLSLEHFFGKTPSRSNKENLDLVIYQIIHFPLVGLWLPYTGLNSLASLMQKSPSLVSILNLNESTDDSLLTILILAFLFLLSWDGMEYLVHRALHRFNFLWRFHKVHHAQHQLNWWSNLRFHSSEILIYKSITIPILWLLWGDSIPELTLWALGMFRFIAGNYAHSTIPSLPRSWGKWINTPDVHLWHHAREISGKNLGVTFTFWDRIGKTFYFPHQKPNSLGYKGDENNQNLWQNLKSPLKS